MPDTVSAKAFTAHRLWWLLVPSRGQTLMLEQPSQYREADVTVAAEILPGAGTRERLSSSVQRGALPWGPTGARVRLENQPGCEVSGPETTS